MWKPVTPSVPEPGSLHAVTYQVIMVSPRAVEASAVLRGSALSRVGGCQTVGASGWPSGEDAPVLCAMGSRRSGSAHGGDRAPASEERPQTTPGSPARAAVTGGSRPPPRPSVVCGSCRTSSGGQRPASPASREKCHVSTTVVSEISSAGWGRPRPRLRTCWLLLGSLGSRLRGAGRVSVFPGRRGPSAGGEVTGGQSRGLRRGTGRAWT